MLIKILATIKIKCKIATDKIYFIMKEWFVQNVSWLLVLVFVPITLAIIKLFNKEKKGVQIKLPVSKIENNPHNVNNNNLTINNLIPNSEGAFASEQEKEICETKFSTPKISSQISRT